MLCRLFCLSLLFMFIAYTANAARVPPCGDIKRRHISESFDLAEDIQRYHDAYTDMVDICAVMEEFEDFDKGLSRDVRSNRDYKDERDDLIERVEEDLIAIEKPLRIYSIWLRVDSNDLDYKARRIVALRESRAHIMSFQEDLHNSASAIQALMANPVQD